MYLLGLYNRETSQKIRKLHIYQYRNSQSLHPSEPPFNKLNNVNVFTVQTYSNKRAYSNSDKSN